MVYIEAMIRWLVFLPLILGAVETKTLYNSLDPGSLTQALAFYELYPESEEGKAALQRASRLLTGSIEALSGSLARLVHRGNSSALSESEVVAIEHLAAHLPNRKLKGYLAQSEKEVLALPSEEIDLGRALLLSQLDGEEGAITTTRAYSAKLDLIALQILAKLPPNATSEQKIRATNHYIFEEMHFRFPPQSRYAKEIDLYTFLPSVMDNHLGVCLGVSNLYLAIAQRIGLPLEVVTPPGHIYVRYRDGEKITNIETTARGIDVPNERYLGVNTRKLKERTVKETIGMTHFNQASVFLHNESFEKAVKCYEKAKLYMPDDPLVKELLGYSYLFVDKVELGKQLLEEVRDMLPEEYVAKENMAADYLDGRVDKEGIRAIFMEVDETRSSILEKQRRIKEVLDRYPNFQAGWHQLAVSWLQLHRFKEATSALKRFHELNSNDPVAEYYLAILHGERRDFPSAWNYLKNAEAITRKRDFSPKALRELRRELIILCPE